MTEAHIFYAFLSKILLILRKIQIVADQYFVHSFCNVRFTNFSTWVKWWTWITYMNELLDLWMKHSRQFNLFLYIQNTDVLSGPRNIPREHSYIPLTCDFLIAYSMVRNCTEYPARQSESLLYKTLLRYIRKYSHRYLTKVYFTIWKNGRTFKIVFRMW